MCVLRWMFQKGPRAITCQVERRRAASFDVCLVPHWDVGSAVIERTDTPVSALHRHAEFVRDLRAAGWSLVRRSR